MADTGSDAAPSDDLTPDEHVALGHAHIAAAHHHTGQAVAHMDAARPPEDAENEPGTEDGQTAGRTMPASAQARAFTFSGGAARTLNAATRGRR